MTLLTPKEILQFNPELRSVFDETKIGSLLWLGLVRGRKLHRTCQVSVEDVKEISKLVRK